MLPMISLLAMVMLVPLGLATEAEDIANLGGRTLLTDRHYQCVYDDDCGVCYKCKEHKCNKYDENCCDPDDDHCPKCSKCDKDSHKCVEVEDCCKDDHDCDDHIDCTYDKCVDYKCKHYPKSHKCPKDKYDQCKVPYCDKHKGCQVRIREGEKCKLWKWWGHKKYHKWGICKHGHCVKKWH